MLISEPVEHLVFDLTDEDGKVWVTVQGQPNTNTWSIRCPGDRGQLVPYIIAHGNPEKQIRNFLASLADAFNRHAES